MNFENPSNLFQNPDFNNERTYDVEQKFKKSGGKILGSGRHSTVYYHPKWKYVLKTFTNDSPYIKFVRFVLKHPRQSYPKFYDKPRRILPNVKRIKEKEFLYIVKTELLYPINKDEFEALSFYRDRGNVTKEQAKTSQAWKRMYEYKLEVEKKYPQIKPFYKDYQFLQRQPELGAEDWLISNIMKRKNGEFVLSDPVWEGETPYQTYDRLMKSELDFGDDYESEPEYIKGGQRYKKPKPPKSAKKPPPADYDEDIPF